MGIEPATTGMQTLLGIDRKNKLANMAAFELDSFASPALPVNCVRITVLRASVATYIFIVFSIFKQLKN